MEKRRSGRIRAVLPLKVSGTDVQGGTFCDLALTLDIGSSGARLGSMRRQLPVGSVVVAQHRHRKAAFEVVWMRPSNNGDNHLVGVKSIQQRDPWGLLNDTSLEAAVAEIQNFDGDREPEASRFLPRRPRAKVTVSACVCEPGSEQIVSVVNMSREGLCFRSRREYVPDTWVRVAVPYMRGGSNIFQISRVAWKRDINGRESEYGVSYLKGYTANDAWAEGA
jgi:PilZ domain-containing protein